MLYDILNFLGQTITAFPKKYQIIFAIGLLNDEYVDKELAVQEFEKFISLAKNNSVYTKLVKESQGRINRNRKITKKNYYIENTYKKIVSVQPIL